MSDDLRAAFVAWGPTDMERQLRTSVDAAEVPEFLDRLSAEMLPVVFDVLDFACGRDRSMSNVERVAGLPPDRARVIFEQAGTYVLRFMLYRVPREDVSAVSEALAWMALVVRGEGGSRG